MNSDCLNALEEKVLLNICGKPTRNQRLSASETTTRRLTIDLVFVVAENNGRRSRLLQALKQVHHLGLLLDVLDLLDNVHTRGSRSTDIDNDRLDQSLLSKVLDTLGHRCREEERLALVLWAKRKVSVVAASERGRDNGP
jgi:hypothetical protein